MKIRARACANIGALSIGALCVATLSVGLVLGCADEATPLDLPVGSQFLLRDGIAATLGIESRLSTAAAGVILLAETFEAGAPLPAFASLPESLAGHDRVLVNYRYWGHPDHTPLPGVRVAQSSALARVDRSVAQPRVPLRIEAIPHGSRVRVQAIAFPPVAPLQTLRYPVALKYAATLELGFGLREECWGPGAQKTEFSVSVVDASGERTVLLDRSLDPGNPEHRRWFDARFDLPASLGPTLTLELETRFSSGSGGYSLPVWSDPILTSVANSTEPQRPDVVLISIDTLRARSLGVHGYARDTSPFIDSLAREGSWFSDAMTTSVTTAPSHMSLFTGLYPVRHGVREGHENKRPGVATAAASLRAAGYRTAAFTENGYLIRTRGFGEGFGRYVENRGGSRAPGEARLTFAQARRWLEANSRSPFFLFIHTYEVHYPYSPKQPYDRLFSDDDAAGPEDVGIRKLRDDYDREIRVVDDELRKLVEALPSTGKRTLLVVTSDHGEEFLEHGGLQHGGAVFDEALRVPLIFWSPGTIPADQRIDSPVSIVDVAPTLLDWVGLEVPPGLDGRSLRGSLLDGDPVEPRVLYAEAHAPRRWLGIWKEETWNPPLIALRSGHEKFIVHRPRTGPAQPTVRFDLHADPLEANPLAVSGESLSAVEAAVDDYLSAAAGAESIETPLSPDVRERLKLLGYH